MKHHAPVSVVIPCHNDGALLPHAIASIAAQEWLPSEVLIVDDASTDDSPLIIQRVQQDFGQLDIKVVTLDKNFGPGPARNIAWSRAKFPYLAFIDADDTWHPAKLRIQVPIMECTPKIIALGARSGRWSPKMLPPATGRIQSFRVGAMLLSNRLPTRTVIVRREVQERFGAAHEAEDFMLWLRLIKRYGSVHRLDCVLAGVTPRPLARPSMTSFLWTHEVREQRSLIRAYGEGIIGPTQLAGASALAFAKYGLRQLRSIG